MQSAEEFLKVKDLFRLGDLPTETPHPDTRNLSRLAHDDLFEAVRILQRVDQAALDRVSEMQQRVQPLFKAVADTLDSGGRIFLVGCGATGRLSISLEYLWRKKNPRSDRVVSLMAGGDVALVHSLEGFEDFPAYGARHLRELGFGKKDLLIAATEGGETPYVIGATEEALNLSNRAPFFLHCNDPEVLIAKVERSKKVLQNPHIHSISLSVGPMALTGSTRMQASTVLMLVAGMALEFGDEVDGAFSRLRQWIGANYSIDDNLVVQLIQAESKVYQDQQYSLYEVGDTAITVFTDTTERAPTFNLPPFDNPKFPTGRNSLTYVSIPETQTAQSAWRKLLGREPRPLNWPEAHAKATPEYLQTFDFSGGAARFRQEAIPNGGHHKFQLVDSSDGLDIRFRDLAGQLRWTDSVPLFQHLDLKMWLNIHSTLVMGRLNRFEGNLMTWVTPSNGKLVDRAARYTQILLAQKGVRDIDYESIVKAQFAVKSTMSPKDSIVHKTMDYLLKGMILN